MARYEDLPYRTCVGVMLINAAGLVFVGRRAGGAEHVEVGDADAGARVLLRLIENFRPRQAG